MLHSRSIEIFRRRCRQLEVCLKTSVSPEWSTVSLFRLAGIKALAVTKQQCTNCTGSPRETDGAVRYKTRISLERLLGTIAIKLTGITVLPVSNQWQTNCNTTIRQACLLLLPTQAYNRSHFYIVRLVWFQGYMNLERRKV